MDISKRIVAVLSIFLVVTVGFPVAGIQSVPQASLVGRKNDFGVDSDFNGKFDYLLVGIEINVTDPGYFGVQIHGLLDSSFNYISVEGSNSSYLTAGPGVLNITLSGDYIYGSGFDLAYISSVSLYSGQYNPWDYSLGSLSQVPLSKIYSHSDFDSPNATLTGKILDQGVDTDFDGKFNYLLVGIEINVTNPAYYEVQISGLLDPNQYYISVGGSNSSDLANGLHVLNVSLAGEYIYVSGLDPQYVNYISLYEIGQYSWERYFLGSLSRVSLSEIYLHTDFDPPSAMLTGKILDRGVDTDGDGTFNYLEISPEINVTKAGDYTVYVGGLRDASGNYYYLSASNRSHLEPGLRYVSISLSGYAIRRDHINATQVIYISLYDGYSSYLNDVNLSRPYLCTEFDVPAVFTGIVTDHGVDTDADGKFNLLEIGVQINVSDPGEFSFEISGLLDSQENFIDAYGYASAHPETGLHFINFTLDGTRISLSGRNPQFINSVSYWFYGPSYYDSYRDELKHVSLSRPYSYGEFDPPPAMLTGKIYDRGVDNDADGHFDFLEVGVEVNVTEAGNYLVYLSTLIAMGPKYENTTDRETYYLYVYDSKTVDLDIGVQKVNLYLYGPEIYNWHHNPSNVSYITVGGRSSYSHSLSNTPLSKVYLYTEFDAPLYDVETKLIVYPDGRVVLEGSLKYTDMVPRNVGPAATGSFNLTGNDLTALAQAGLKLTFPEKLATQFPYNSTTASMLATYSNGLLNVGLNSSMILPPSDPRYYPYYPFGQWPYNSTDGTVTMTYSGGILNVDVNGETTLPSMAKSQFPFNSTDVTIIGGYAGNQLDGMITFSVLDDFTFDDVNVAFTGNRTDLVLSGTVSVLFGVPLGSLVIHNSTELEQLLDEMRSTIPGQNGLVWNMTGGWLNVTNFDVTQTPLQGINGAEVTFEILVHGDFVQALTHLVSGGKNPELLYPAVNEAYSSVRSATFAIDYDRTSSIATVNLTFSYDLKRLVDNALAPPAGAYSYVIASSTMSPTLMRGDVVFAEPIANFSEIAANPANGDIIAFYRPDYYSPYNREVIVHRAISRTIVNGTVFFQTKGDANYSPDPWSVPQDLVIGKVVSRVPLLGFLLVPNLINYYWYPTMAVPLEFGIAAFSSVQEASLQLSYSRAERRFDLEFTLVDQLKGLFDEIVQKLPQAWPPGSPPEAEEFLEKLLNTTYASVSSAVFSLKYGDGIADFKATVNIEGDINKEIGYVKDLYYQLYKTSYGNMNMTIPWQLDFINQTRLTLNNFKVSAQLDETSFEGKIRGVTIIPPREFINATHFTLRQLFNLTAPQYSGQQELPGENQRLRITIKGGSNATNSITLYRSLSVPEPDVIGPYSKSMTWFNQTFSSLKDLVFTIGPPLKGTLTIITEPVIGEVFVNGESWGLAPQSRVVDIDTYDVSFGDVSGYATPAQKSVVVNLDQETIVKGVYAALLKGTLSITTTPVSGEVFVNGVSWGRAPQSRVVEIGTYTVSFGAKQGYTPPANQVVTVLENTETPVNGVYQAIPGTVAAEIDDPDSVSQTNPFIVNATGDTGAYLVISQISDPVTLVVKNVTDYEDMPPPGTWKLLGNCVEITVNDTDVTVSAVIRIYYTPEQLEAAGLDESTLKIHYWNATSSQWVQVESNVETSEHFVWAIVDHFSMWAIMGQEPTQTIPYWLIIGGVAVAAIVIALLGFYVRRRKPETQ